VAVIEFVLVAFLTSIRTAHGSTPPSADPIGTAVATYNIVNVTAPVNDHPYGLAFDSLHYPHRLYVSNCDTISSGSALIFVYEIGSAGLTDLSSERIGAKCDNPRGLAIAYVDNVEYLYYLESNSVSGGGSGNFLWRYDMLHKLWDTVDLNSPIFGVDNRELLGLEYYNGDVFIGYDTAGMTDDVRHGILQLKVVTESGGTDWWSLAKAADPSVIVADLPNSGRGPWPGTAYDRDPCRGLAAMVLGDTFYLWGTTLGCNIYSADGVTGRGLFYFESPPYTDGKRYYSLYDLAFGDNYLWAVERIDGNHNAIHKIKVATDFDVPLQSGRHVRRITMTLHQDSTGGIGLGRSPNGVLHSYMLPNSYALRPNQDRDLASLTDWGSKAFVVDSSTYDPAGDTSSEQEKRDVHFTSTWPAKELDSNQTIDVWTSDYQNFVYPHLCSTASVPSADYLTTSGSDSKYINGLNTSATTYGSFMSEVNATMVAEYGPTAISTNPYWIARNISEFLREHFNYGPLAKADMKPGEGVWNPVQYKLQRYLEGDVDHDLLTCSSTAFVTEALCRSVSVPARWVGTTRFRDSFKNSYGDTVSWDTDGDGLMGSSEGSHDQDYHRWAEVWLGPTYGWQRFDGTPDDTLYEQSQWDMMGLCAHGVDANDLVTTVGKGYYDGMYDSVKKMQKYNTCGHYDSKKWKLGDETKDPDTKAIYWTVPCYVFVNTPSNPQSGPTINLTWTLGGRWDLDPDATVSIYAFRLGATDLIELATGIDPAAGSATVSTNTFYDGYLYELYLIKDGDEITGGRTGSFLYDSAP